MDLIDRYLYAVGRQLPRRGREDILAELRSSLMNSLEERSEGQPSEEAALALLQELGPPSALAASYYPEGQYLIGPGLFPLFKLVVGMALVAVLGFQALGHAAAYFLKGVPFNPVEVLLGQLTTIPTTVGMVVLVFYLLQRIEGVPGAAGDPWDPRGLPALPDGRPVDRGAQTVGIILSIAFLTILAYFTDRGALLLSPELRILVNPVLARYFGWLVVTVSAEVGLALYLLWRGHWSRTTRWLQVGAHALNVAVLWVLVSAHSDWLAQRGANAWVPNLPRLWVDMAIGEFVSWMQAFRLVLGVALGLNVLEALLQAVQLVRDRGLAAALQGG